MSRPVTETDLSTERSPSSSLWQREKLFVGMIGCFLILAGSTHQMPEIARWVGFLMAGYSAIANDSIQTIGTFLASNKQKPWWALWLFIGGIFVVTMTYSWITYSGDVTFERLASKGFEQSPTEFSFLQIAAPIFLLVLTRLRMPVSTTFLLLTSFSQSASSVGKVMMKSFTGYFLAFGIAIAVWVALSPQFKKWFRGDVHPMWHVFQWCTTGTLWSIWLMQDAANIAVYLPLQLSLVEFLGFVLPIFLGLGVLFKMGGERIQQIVDEKSSVVDIRAATVIDLIYAGILFYFKLHSKIPMSTTWVFLGLIGGREVAMSLRQSSDRSIGAAVRMMFKDTGLALVGLLVSLIIAIACNDAMYTAVLGSLGVK